MQQLNRLINVASSIDRLSLGFVWSVVWGLFFSFGLLLFWFGVFCLFVFVLVGGLVFLKWHYHDVC